MSTNTLTHITTISKELAGQILELISYVFMRDTYVHRAESRLKVVWSKDDENRARLLGEAHLACYRIIYMKVVDNLRNENLLDSSPSRFNRARATSTYVTLKTPLSPLSQKMILNAAALVL